MPDAPDSMSHADYARRMVRHSEAPWKRLIGAQIPYRLHIRRIARGRVLDIGCGIGRNLLHLGGGVGVDTNAEAVHIARQRGLETYTSAEFADSPPSVKRSFDTLLFSHVLEHMPGSGAQELVSHYLPFLGQGGRVIIIVPQEAGFASDPTHVEPVGEPELRRIADANHLILERIYSFPMPRWVGRWFRHNETVALLLKP